MKNHNTNAGLELLFLLRQQRYLYHQLKILAERQQQLAGTDSPELLLEVINGRRKIVEKLWQLNDKLRPIRANWDKLSDQIEPEHKTKANEMSNEVRQIIGEIQASTTSANNHNLPLDQQWNFDELLAET